MLEPRVLVSGASIAGPALAFWLVRAGCSVTVVERAARLRSEGQGVDIRGAARAIARQMGIFEAIRARSSHEAGIEFVDSHARPFAKFAVDLETGNSMTSDVEILRGDLAQLLHERTARDVEYRFGDTVQGKEETEKGVRVAFQSGRPSETYDLVVAADGIGSRIRSMAFAPQAARIVSKNAFVAYFSLPAAPTDNMWAKVHWIAGGRCLAIRPGKDGDRKAFLMMTFYDPSDARLARLHRAATQGVAEQKALVQELFHDADWEGPRLLEGMRAADDFYFQHVAQVRMDHWASGRVAVVGDAAYAPTPFSGMGTSLAFIGAYVLAGEISKSRQDIPAALRAYERIVKPYVDGVQKLPPGVPWIANPQSALGVSVLQNVMWCLSTWSSSWLATATQNVARRIPPGLRPWSGESGLVLPEYAAFKKDAP